MAMAMALGPTPTTMGAMSMPLTLPIDQSYLNVDSCLRIVSCSLGPVFACFASSADGKRLGGTPQLRSWLI